MKRIVIASATALVALTGAASAMTSGQVSGLQAGLIHGYLPGFDLTTVSADTAQDAVNYIREYDSEASHAKIQNGVRFILENANG